MMRESGSSNKSSRRIIIADDESLIRLDLREMLTHLGYDVIGEAGDGQTAIELALKLRPDLVVMDIKMPDVDGITAAESLTRERVAPVVLLTAYSDQPLVERAKEAGVVGYVVKPFREAELMPVIELSLARFEEFRALETEVGGLKEALESRKVVERAKGVLMEVHGLRESEAFHRIRKTSMDARKSMKEVAEAILLTHEMDFGSSGQSTDATPPVSVT
jgi:response regulator NasT